MDIKAFLGVNIVQEGLEKFIKENSTNSLSSLKASNLKENKLKGNSPSSSKKVLDVLWGTPRLLFMCLDGSYYQSLSL
jgi:hypothetical protein